MRQNFFFFEYLLQLLLLFLLNLHIIYRRQTRIFERYIETVLIIHHKYFWNAILLFIKQWLSILLLAHYLAHIVGVDTGYV